MSNVMSNMRQRRLICTIGLLAAALLLPGWLDAQGAPPSRPVDYTLPVVSADGRLVFFIGDGPTTDNLHVVRSDGSDEKRLTHDGAHLPRWIGNPGEITFAGPGTSPDSGRVFAMKPDGSNRRVVASIPGRSPVLSPDGTRVAYLVGPWRTAEIWVANVDGTAARKVAGGAPTWSWNPAWSPDGSRLAYTYGDSTQRLQIHIVKVVGSVRDTAITDTLDSRMASQLPAWSLDGLKLAFQWDTESGQGSGIAVINMPTRTVKRFDIPPPDGRSGVRDETPSWFPDGRQIVFRSNRSGNVDLWVMAEDGSNLRQVTGVARR